MADGPHKYHIVGSVGGGGGVVTDLQSVFGVGRGRRVKIFAYGFLFAFVAATAFLAFNPSVATSSPWFDRFFSASSSTSASSSVRSQFSNLISSIFPASHPSVTANAARPSGATDKGVVSGSRATNFTASLGRKNATIGASEAARNGTEQERSPAESKTAPAKNATKIESSDQKVPTSSKNQTFAQNPKNQTMSLDKQPSSVAGDRRNKSKTVDLKPKNGTFASNPTAKKVGADQPARQYSLESMKKCDLFDGKWVKDDSYPLYKEGSCPHIDQPFDCFLNGRPDQDFQKLRWQPKGCNIPRLNGTDMLERLRGRRLVFVGDSLNRNMWESLVCTLSNSVKDKNKVFEASGRREFRTEGSYSFVFEDYNCSVEFFRSPFLVQEWESPELNGTTKETLRLDLIEKKSDRYKKADVIVFNTGHWWTHEKTSLGKDYYQEGSHVYGQLNVVEAFHKALATWAKWVDSKVDPHKTLVFFRGYSSSHFSGGRWNSGGSCDKETQPITNEAYLAKYPRKMKVLETVLKEMKTSVSYLNITRMTDYRKDAHPSVYRKRNLTVEERTSPLRYQDCSHWCLPGVPDSWNELLYAEMLIKLH